MSGVWARAPAAVRSMPRAATRMCDRIGTIIILILRTTNFPIQSMCFEQSRRPCSRASINRAHNRRIIDRHSANSLPSTSALAKYSALPKREVKKTFRLSAERRRWWRAAMRPHRLDRAAWRVIAEFERDLDRQMKELRTLLLREFGKLPRQTRRLSSK